MLPLPRISLSGAVSRSQLTAGWCRGEASFLLPASPRTPSSAKRCWPEVFLTGEAECRLLEDVDCPGDHKAEDGQGTCGLQGHRQLAPAGERHHVGGAECRCVGESKVEVVGEFWPPSWRGDHRVELFGEGKVGESRGIPDARLWAASVEQPVQEGKGEDGEDPDAEADAKQL